MTAKRVLIFSLTYSPFIGCAEVAVKEITERIEPSDISFDMVTLQADSNLPSVEKIANVTVYRVGPGKQNITLGELSRFPWYLIKVLYVPLAVLKAHTLARKNRYDAYWAVMTNMGFPIVLLKMLFGDTTPFILTLQDGDTKEHITSRR